jgi:nitroimidazol reductase NimA-like FMN-containing flavoprotein (pyridoxamine 5'-phosphate oxidase superfamily)
MRWQLLGPHDDEEDVMSDAAQQPEVPDRVLDYLGDHATLTVATVSGAGVPRAATFTYANDGLALYVWTHPDSTTARNVAQNPLVSFAIDAYSEDWRKIVGLQGTGEAHVLLNADEIARVIQLFAGKFPSLKPDRPANVSFFRITPSEVQLVEGAEEGEAAGQELGLEYRREVVFSVFRDLPPRELATVAGKLQTAKVDAGTVIVRQGAPADKFFIIVEGGVEILREDDGDERTLNTLGQGDYFGEVAILRDSPRIASVRATAPTTLLTMDRDTFRNLVAGSLGTTEQFDSVIRERMVAAGETGA